MKVKKQNEFFLAIQHTDSKEKGAVRTPFYYRICVDLIADRLPSGRACFLLRPTA